MRSSIQDLYLFTLSDVFIVANNSGFGKVAAMLKKTSQHTILITDTFLVAHPNCSVLARDDLDYIGSHWSGI